VTYQEKPGDTPGIVLRQDPDAGHQVPKGSRVSLTLSREAAVPNFAGTWQLTRVTIAGQSKAVKQWKFTAEQNGGIVTFVYPNHSNSHTVDASGQFALHGQRECRLLGGSVTKVWFTDTYSIVNNSTMIMRAIPDSRSEAQGWVGDTGKPIEYQWTRVTP